MTVSRKGFAVEGTRCVMYRAGEKPEALIIQAVDRRELEGLDSQIETEKQLSDRAFLHVAFEVSNWNKDLSPWEAPAVFGSEGFGSGAKATLDFIEKTLMSKLIENKDIESATPIILGGYSLSGLFALWCSYQTTFFKAIAAVSPSVWFPRWIDYAKENSIKTEHVYLSLGDKEAKTKNATMATVKDCIEELQRILEEKNVDNTLQWNSGNHFTEPDLRCAKGFSWCLRKSGRGV